MKIKITPLNFATAFFLFAAFYVWVKGASVAGAQYKHLGTAIGWISILFAVVVSFLDLTFRNFFPQAKNLWLVELSFITLTAVLFLLVK